MTHILIVEDDKELCQLYSRVLTKSGYQVTGVDNGLGPCSGREDIEVRKRYRDGREPGNRRLQVYRHTADNQITIWRYQK